MIMVLPSSFSLSTISSSAQWTLLASSEGEGGDREQQRRKGGGGERRKGGEKDRKGKDRGKEREREREGINCAFPLFTDKFSVVNDRVVTESTV